MIAIHPSRGINVQMRPMIIIQRNYRKLLSKKDINIANNKKKHDPNKKV